MDKQDFYQDARSDIKGPLDGVRVVEACCSAVLTIEAATQAVSRLPYT